MRLVETKNVKNKNVQLTVVLLTIGHAANDESGRSQTEENHAVLTIEHVAH